MILTGSRSGVTSGYTCVYRILERRVSPVSYVATKGRSLIAIGEGAREEGVDPEDIAAGTSLAAELLEEALRVQGWWMERGFVHRVGPPGGDGLLQMAREVATTFEQLILAPLRETPPGDDADREGETSAEQETATTE